MPPIEQEWFCVKEAASRMGLSAKTVRRLIKQGRLRASRFGRMVRIHRSAIDRTMEEAEE
jgi:excisionase family DNA binding protein